MLDAKDFTLVHLALLNIYWVWPNLFARNYSQLRLGWIVFSDSCALRPSDDFGLFYQTSSNSNSFTFCALSISEQFMLLSRSIFSSLNCTFKLELVFSLSWKLLFSFAIKSGNFQPFCALYYYEVKKSEEWSTEEHTEQPMSASNQKSVGTDHGKKGASESDNILLCCTCARN